ncbi:MAG: mechanosensitive ion channel protein [Phycisphaeraceae bacterium]|nr:mechanosensitive ion channel protein [Phycisphaeraceae bacterium]
MLLTLGQEAATQATTESGSNLMQQIQENGLLLFTQYGIPAITALLILFIGFLIAGWLSGSTLKACNKTKLDLTLSKFIARMVKWLVLLLTGIFILGKFGINTASFAVVLGAAGLAIGLAFQGTLSNFAAGIMLLVFRPYKVGDVVTVSGTTGKVDEVELFTTTLDTPDNRRFIIPNSAIFGSTIENITFHPRRRVDVAVGVSYSADIDKTRQVLIAAANSIEKTLDDPEKVIMLTGLGASSVDWVVRVWANTSDFWGVKEDLTRAIKMHLDEAGISIPFPQMDIHLDKIDSED